MKTTTDTLTGKGFRWNTIVTFSYPDGATIKVPGRCTSSTEDFLHPARVRPALLAELNASRDQSR